MTALTSDIAAFVATVDAGSMPERCNFGARIGMLDCIGTMIAGAVTFPLVFGWLHFSTRLDDPETYRVMLFGLGVGEFSCRSLIRYVMFNLLNVSAVMVITV